MKWSPFSNLSEVTTAHRVRDPNLDYSQIESLFISMIYCVTNLEKQQQGKPANKPSEFPFLFLFHYLLVKFLYSEDKVDKGHTKFYKYEAKNDLKSYL